MFICVEYIYTYIMKYNDETYTCLLYVLNIYVMKYNDNVHRML